MNFAVLADHKMKIKERENRDKLSDHARELSCRTWVMVKIIVISALGVVLKSFERGLKDVEIAGRIETTQTTALLRYARIPRRVLEA